MGIQVQSEGRRHYLTGDTYAVRQQLRSAGLHWDGDRKAWWGGKRGEVEALAAKLSAPAPDSERKAETAGPGALIHGRAMYQGREYLVLWQGETRKGPAFKLSFRDGAKVFWADAAQVQWAKRYREPLTLRQLDAFAAERKAEEKAAPKSQPEGTTYISRRSQDRHDNYDVGAVLHCTRIPGGGGDDGRYWTVVAVLPKYQDDDTDEWHCAAYARPATAEECAPLIERRRSAEERRALLAELSSFFTVAQLLPEYSVPPGRTVDLHRSLAGHSSYLLADGAVYRSESSYDDTPRAWRTTEPRAIEIMERLLGGGQ